ncbi:MAG TPA: hypothetical protein VMI34_01835 [Candidatus Bathyarchaeia archaeon]|nr:hypothetical protein [Candidatus Bathyarchaeia archaeon]
MAWTLWAAPLHAASVDFEAFVDRQHYTAVLLQQGRVQVDADFNEEQQGAIEQGRIFRIFSFGFDPAVVLPVVGPGIVSGLAVGAGPNGTLGGDQGFSLHVTPGLALTAFGAEISFGPFDGNAGAGLFRLLVGCPDLPCLSVDSLSGLNPHGGSLFLGVVARPGVVFDEVALESVTPRDSSGEPNGPVPPWQLDSITFAAVPAPATLLLVAAGLGGLTLLGRIIHERERVRGQPEARRLPGRRDEDGRRQHRVEAARS